MVMRTRMQPLAKLFDRYPRVIRDIARATAKDIDLLKRIKHLVKEQGFTLQGAREQLRREPSEAVATDTPQDDLRQRLLEIREGLLRLRDEE